MAALTELDIQAGLFAPPGEGEETAEVYRREAQVLYRSDREAAAGLLLDAAYANDRDENPCEVIVRDLRLAVSLCPESGWVHSAAHRLMLKLGLWREALVLIEHELSLGNTQDEAVALCLTASDLLWIVADSPDDAMKYVERALSIDPTCVGALYAGLWLGNVDTQQAFSESLAKIMGTPAERAVLYDLSGSILKAHGQETRALECYAQAVQADRSNPYVLLRYAVLNEKFNKFAEAAQAYAQAAQIFEDSELSGEFYHRAGVILSCLDQHERSSFYLLEAQKRLSDKYAVTWLAADACRRTGNYQKAVELEQQLIGLASDPETKAAHWLTIADAAEALEAPDLAINALIQAGAAGCGDIADSRLAALYEARGDWDKRAEALERMKGRAKWDSQALTWLQGEALWQHEDHEAAIQTFSGIASALGRWRTHLGYEVTEDHTAHAHLLEEWAMATKDPGTHDALLGDLIVLLTERLHAPEIAMQYLQRMPALRESRDLGWKRINLAMQLQKYESVFEGLISFANDTADEEEALMWKLEAARLQDRLLNDFDGAVESLRSIHEKAPTYVPAVVLLHDMALRNHRYDLVILANTWRDGFQTSSERRAESASENAWASLRLDDIRGAAVWFEQAMQIAPLGAYHLRQYVELLRQLGRWDDAVRVIRENVNRESGQRVSENAEAVRTDPDLEVIEDDDSEETPENAENKASAIKPEADVMFEMMLDIQTFCLKHSSGTLYARLKYFEEKPVLSCALSYLIDKLALEAPSVVLPALSDLRAKLTGTSEEVQALLDWVEATLIRSTTVDTEDAKTSSQICLLLKRSLDYKYGPCLRAEMLRCLRAMGTEDETAWLERYASQTQDKWMAMALSREAAMRSIWVDEDYEVARRVLMHSLVREDSDRRTLWMLEHFSAVSEDWKALGYFRERLAQTESSPKARLQALKSSLAPYVDDDQTDHAVRIAQECLKLDNRALPALVTLAHIAEDSEDMYSLACIADRLSDASSYGGNRTEYGLWAAQLWSQSLKKDDQAIMSLNRLLALEPACMPAIHLSEQLHKSLGRYEQLGVIYSRAIAVLPEGEAQIEILRKQAELLAKNLNDAPAASLSLTRIIKQAPDDADALSSLSELLIVQSRWSEAVETLEQLSRVADTPEKKRQINLKLADILIHQLQQPDHAKRILKRHLMQFEHDIAALQLLYDIACSERNWMDAKNTLEEISRDETTLDARHARMAFTHVAREAGWSHDIRTMYERQAIDAVIDHREDFDALVADYSAHNELGRLIDVAKRELSQQGTVEQIARYRGCVAALLVANRQHREALAFLSEIIHDSQNTDWAYLARAQALTSAGQLESAVGEFRRTLTRNIKLRDAFEPFLEVLKQTGDEISLAAVTAVRDAGTETEGAELNLRCVSGAPRGYFDVDHMGFARQLVDAQRYLRQMTPYAFELFNDHLQPVMLDSSHWAYTRCYKLFGQNLEVKQIFVAKRLKNELCIVKLQETPGLIFDERLLREDKMVEFDFWAAYAMHQAVTGGCLIDVLDDAHVDALFSALCQAKPESADAQVMKKNLFRALPRTERKLFKDGVPFLAPNWTEFRNALRTRAACVAAVISASPAYALKAHPGDPALEVFLISESYVRFVRTYWTHGLAVTG
ncbi:MAG: hypothetical protein II767_09435 [Proteobacteria bacterium]|nr:hypothetical protein [Pseudomonadota bacterium]